MKTTTVLAGKGMVTASFMQDCTLQASIPMLRERLERDGFLLIRDFLPALDIEKVSTPLRCGVLEFTRKAWPSQDTTHMQARHSLLLALRDDVGIPSTGRNIGLIERQDLAQSASVLAVLESPYLFKLMQDLMVRHLCGCPLVIVLCQKS